MPCLYRKKGHIKSAFKRSVNVGGERPAALRFALTHSLICKEVLFEL